MLNNRNIATVHFETLLLIIIFNIIVCKPFMTIKLFCNFTSIQNNINFNMRIQNIIEIILNLISECKTYMRKPFK